MEVIYTCPKCGHDLQQVVLTCNPPIYRSECPNCGWSHERRDNVIRIPYTEEKDNVVDLGDGWLISSGGTTAKNACEYCSNNPKNGGSGVCHCILGSMITC